MSVTDPAAPAADPGALFRTAMQRVVSSVAIIAWRGPDGPRGLAHTALTSAGSEPPRLAVCLRRATGAPEQIAAAGAFTVNFLSDEQSLVARGFSASAPGGASPFEPGAWADGPGGAPMLTEGVAAFECAFERIVDCDAHVMLFGRVQTQRTGEGSGLLYRDGFLRRLGAE